MSLKIHAGADNEAIREGFIKDHFVLKITITNYEGKSRDHGMVITREDYEKKMYTHAYRPLLWLAPFHLKVAYLYGCLNTEFERRKTCTYTIWYRKVGTTEWEKWYDALPYYGFLF